MHSELNQEIILHPNRLELYSMQTIIAYDLLIILPNRR